MRTFALIMAAVCLGAVPQLSSDGSAKTELVAQGIERRMNELSRELDRANAKVGLADAARAAMLDASAPDSKESIAAKFELKRALDENHRATVPIILELSALGQRLRRYKETGDLPPTVPDVRQLRRFIEDPWAKKTPLPGLELDIAALVKQLKSYDDIGRKALPVAAAKPSHESRPSIVPVPRRREAAVPTPRFERDAGRADPETDPVPSLMDLLSSVEPRQRALAADELGARGSLAAPAIPALRRALSDRDPRVRASVVLALGGIGSLPPEAVDELRRALSDQSADVRLSARTALERLGAASGALRRDIGRNKPP